MNGLIFLSLVAAATAHICMISPHQRGSMVGLNQIAASDCALFHAPCGGRPAEDAQITLTISKNFTVTFMKNLDHWVKGHAGHFTVSVAMASDMHFNEVSTIPDMGEPSLHIYSVDLVIPDSMKRGAAVFQVQYVTNNPHAPPNFYQCADVTIA